MVLFLSLRWWYSSGWGWVWRRSVVARIKSCFDFFSTPTLIRTWFSPFKQTTKSARKGSIDTKIQTAIDNLVSRIIGTMARTVLIFIGLVCALLAFVSGVLMVIAWPLIPVTPLISILLAMRAIT